MTQGNSSPPPSKDHNHQPPAAVAPVSPVAGTADLTEKSATAAPAAIQGSQGSLLFSVALVVLAVLPVALGFGVIRAKASAKPASEMAVDHHEADEVVEPPVFLDRRVGDREFLARRYESALYYYQSLSKVPANRMPPELLYRICLCQEGLGKWDEALQNLRIVSERTQTPLLRCAADFGQARIYLRMNDPLNALALLRSLQLRSQDGTTMPSSMTRECSFLLPIALSSGHLSRDVQANGGRGGQVGGLIPWALEGCLDWGADPEVSPSSLGGEVMDPLADADQPANDIVCQILESPSTPSSTDSAVANVRLELDANGQPVERVLESIAAKLGWKLTLLDAANAEQLSSPVKYMTEDSPASLILTSLCSEADATWSVENRQLVVRPGDTDRERIQRMIGITLSDLVDWSPNSRLVGHVRLIQGQIAENEGDTEKAAKYYSAAAGRDTSPLTIRAAYDAALQLIKLGDYTQACYYLDIVVNGAPGHELHLDALVLFGRLLLDRGLAQDAIFQLRRATEPRARNVRQARAAVLLALAHLIQDRNNEAAEVILENRWFFEDQEARYAAAFVTAYARWQVVTGELKKREASYLYRSMAALNTEAEWLGQVGRLLAGRALADVEMEERMADLYSRTLEQKPTAFVEPEITFSLANYEYAHDRVDSAKERWSKVAGGSVTKWSNRARVRLAEASLREGKARVCLEYCEATKGYEGIVRADLCKLMGRAHEQLGENDLAARFYAGQLPNP